MARLNKKISYLGLKDYPVYKEDTDNTIFNVVNVPEVFPQGKSYFLLLGSKQLRQGSEVLVEILDSRGQVIYYEIPYYLENAGRAISVWIYDHIVPGEAFVTLIGELSNVPAQWKNVFNIKRTFRIFVNPQITNLQPIRFSQLPKLSVSYVERNYLVYSEDRTKLTTYSGSGQAGTEGVWFGVRNRLYSNTNLTQPGYIVTIYDSAVTGPFASTPGKLRSEFIGASFTGSGDPTILYNPTTEFNISARTEYRGIIVKLVDSTSFETSFEVYPPIINDPAVSGENGYWVFDTLDPRTDPPGNPKYRYEINYLSQVTGSPSILTSSFAEIKIQDLFTFSGKVDTIKVYKKNLTADTNYLLLGQYTVEPTELFLASGSINQTLGTFNSSSTIYENWTSSSLDGSPLNGSILPSVTWAVTPIFNSVKLQPYYNTEVDHELRRFKFYPLKGSMLLPGSHEYTVKAKYYCEPDGYNIPNSASLGIYISGSAVNHDVLNDALGKRIGFLTSPTIKNFGELEFNFITDRNGYANLNFVVYDSTWYIADISIMPATDIGFNPDELTIYAPLTNLKRNEVATFKVEFLNSHGEIAPDIIETTIPILLKNQPVYIELEDNLITGSLSLGNRLDTGIIMSGKEAPSIRSYGFAGRTAALESGSGGFIQFSGSVMDGYRGIGFELDAGHNTGSLYFRYDPPSGSYLIISASIYALSGSNLTSASGGGLWTQSLNSSSIHRVGNVEITGSLFVSGEFVYVSSSIIYSSGSTKFGDSLDDTHKFTGSVYITNSLYVDGPIEGTASWAISASYALNADTYFYGGIASQSFGNSVTWSFAHNLDTKYVIIQTYDTNGFQIIPSNILLIDNNNAEIYFTPAAEGIAVASIGGSSIIKQATITLVCSDEITPLTASNALTTFYMPYDLNVLNVKCSLNASGSESTSIDIKRNGNTIFNAPMLISASEYTGSLVPVSSSLLENDRIVVDLISTGTGSAGLKVYLLGY